jgi:SP family sugar:H+ symporter-like MFS transporter
MSSFSPLIADDIGPLILLIFFGCLIGAIIYVFFFIPETKGLSCLKCCLSLANL